MTRNTRAVVAAFVMTCIFWGIPSYLRYLNPDVTTTRLSIEYWWVAVILVILALPIALVALHWVLRGK